MFFKLHPWSGTIAYTEFLAAIMDHHIEERKDLALAAFRGFDVDGSGTITSKEMERVTWTGEVETWDNFHQVCACLVDGGGLWLC